MPNTVQWAMHCYMVVKISYNSDKDAVSSRYSGITVIERCKRRQIGSHQDKPDPQKKNSEGPELNPQIVFSSLH